MELVDVIIVVWLVDVIIVVWLFVFFIWFMVTTIEASASKKAWQQFAESNNLHFKPGGFFTASIIEGDFRGYLLSLKTNFYTLHRRHTTFEIRRNETLNYSEKRQTDSDIMRRFWDIYNRIKSGNRLNIKSEMIFFRSEPIA